MMFVYLFLSISFFIENANKEIDIDRMNITTASPVESPIGVSSFPLLVNSKYPKVYPQHHT